MFEISKQIIFPFHHMKTISSLLAFVSLTSSFFLFQISPETNWNDKFQFSKRKNLF